MVFICEYCQQEMELIKQKYICKHCGHINACCEGDRVCDIG